MEPIRVASIPPTANALERLAAAGLLPGPVELVALDDDGRVAAGSADGVRIMWRRGWLDARRVAGALEHLPELAWMHSDTVGVEGLPLDRLAERGVVLTNGVGSFTRPMAEWVLLAMLAAAKRLAQFVRASDAGRWERPAPLAELDGSVLLLLGLGSVGRLVAELATPFGVEVRAAVRRPRAQRPRGVAKLVTGPAWRAELPDADFVALALPVTAETQGMLDTAAFAALKPGAWLVNVARGALVDEDALVAALDGGRLGGAVLDAFTTEPLPPGHRLWGRDNVIVVPHFTWSSTRVLDRVEELFAAQLRRWAAGEPLANVVDPTAGY